MSETFLSRWSRRKREASIPPPQGEGGEDRRSEPGGGASPPPVERAESPPHPDPLPASEEREIARATEGEPHGPALQETEFDPASLPPIESIDASTDVSAFMRPGVPADLAQAALRRAWMTDPAIRDFVGPAENAWDFNAPGGVPGFGPLHAIEDVRRLAAQVAGMLSSVTQEGGTEEAKRIAESNEAPGQTVVAQQPETEALPDDAASQKDAPAHDV